MDRPMACLVAVRLLDSARYLPYLANLTCGLIMSHYICQGIESDRVICFVHAASALPEALHYSSSLCLNVTCFQFESKNNDSRWNQVWNLDDYACSRGLAGNRMRF